MIPEHALKGTRDISMQPCISPGAPTSRSSIVATAKRSSKPRLPHFDTFTTSGGHSKSASTGRGRGRRFSNGKGSTVRKEPKKTSIDRGFSSADSHGLYDSDVDDLRSYLADAELSDSEVAELLGSLTVQSGPPDRDDPLQGVDCGLEARLTEILGLFDFTLDPFQVSAVRRVLMNKSVVVCAPTGAGKTAIAEAASIHHMAHGKRIIYTTPLKALSNQKLFELRERFGSDAVGLQTGDASINPEAGIVVMTTEILRNILYRQSGSVRVQHAQPEEGCDAAAPAPGVVTPTRLDDVAMVVLDEVHYLGDPSRGSVWEEVIIAMPPGVQILAMSATVRNPDDLGGWITQVHGECETITTTWRPVPLTWHFCFTAKQKQTRLLPLLDSRGKKMNPMLISPSKRLLPASENFDREFSRWDNLRGARALEELIVSSEGEEDDGDDDRWHDMPRWKRVPELVDSVLSMKKQDMLPAIWFIFSRRECDSSTARLGDALPVGLTSQKEKHAIQMEIEMLRREQPEAVKEALVQPLIAGIASHHAGCLPAWKSLIERLFQQGLLKLVFATETLAAGINMPARTTVISALSRRRDEGIASLLHNELLQMAGRAGRRGFDEKGNCVILQTRWEDPDVAWDIIRKGSEPLRSQFTTGYGMVLNLLYSRTIPEARDFLEKSFSRYLGGIGREKRALEIQTLEKKASMIMEDVGNGTGGETSHVWLTYEKLQGRLREEKRARRALREQFSEERGTLADIVLSQYDVDTQPLIVGLDLQFQSFGGNLLPGVLLRRIVIPGDATVQYLCFAADNCFYLVQGRNIGAYLTEKYSNLDAHDGQIALHHIDSVGAGAWREQTGAGIFSASGSALTAVVVTRLPPNVDQLQLLCPSDESLDALKAQQQRVKTVKNQLSELKADKAFVKASRKYNRQVQKATMLLERAEALKQEVEAPAVDASWRAFGDLMEILLAVGAFESETENDRVKFLAIGQVARELNGTNELWLALVATHPALAALEPPQLAAALSTVVASDAISSRAGALAAYPPSTVVQYAVESLEKSRGELFALQMRAGVEIPIAVDLRLAGLVEAWASGASWEQVMSDCSLDDGDVVRLLTRTVDILRQIRHCQWLLPSVRTAARKAMVAMDRKPITELVM